MTFPAIVNPKALIAPYIAIATSAIDVVGVFDSNYKQVFPNARPLRAFVKPETKLMEHPLETGAVITDFKIMMPIEIELMVILKPTDYEDTYQRILQYYTNSSLFIIQTRANTYTNQVLQAIPHEETPEIYDTITMALKFKQVQFANTIVSTIFPQNASDNSTVGRGQQQGKPATPEQSQKTSLLYDGFFAIKQKIIG